MTDPFITQSGVTPVKVEEGNNYFWCSCGKSENQPFCDVSQKDTGMTPTKFTAPASKKVFFCGCKNLQNRRFVTASIPICSRFIITTRSE